MNKIIHIIKCVFFFIINLFSRKPKQSGELVVTGKNKVEIPIGYTEPKKLIIKFKGECIVVPCSPQNYDELDWEIERPEDGNQYTLDIYWDVSGVRVIKWFIF